MADEHVVDANMEAYFVDVDRALINDADHSRMRYVAMAETPEEAIAAVRPLVDPEATLRCLGASLSLTVARVLGIKPGSARLV